MRDGEIVLGPGKAMLLEFIRETGSIAAAGRKMGMSYKRAWQLVETMNRVFREPLVESSRGGADHGGARLTKAGETALSHYSSLMRVSSDVGADDLDAIARMLA